MGFADGFRAGQGMVTGWQNADRQKVLDARAETLYNEGREDRKHMLVLRDEENAAFAGYNNAAAGLDPAQQKTLQETYGMNPGQVAAELRAGGAEGLRTKLAGYDTPDGGGAPMGTGFNASQLKTAAPDKLQMERMLGRIATAKRDTVGMRESGKEVKNLEYSGALESSGKAWDAMSDDDRAAQIKKLSYDQNVRGFGNWVSGTGKTQGYMNYLPDGGDPVQISAKEARAIWQLSHTMAVDPVRARTEMDAVSDKVRTVAKELFGERTKAAKETNDTRFNQGQLAVAEERNRAAMIAAQRERGGGGKEPDQKFVTQLNDINQRINEATSPAEIKKLENEYRRVQSLAYTSVGKVAPFKESRAEKREVDPVGYSNTYAKFVSAGMDPADAAIKTDQMFGRGPTDGVSDSRLQKLDKGGGAAKKPVVVRPGENGMRDPSQPVMGDPRDFSRVSQRGMFGGVNYGYQDPVTGKKYSADEYNRLLAE